MRSTGGSYRPGKFLGVFGRNLGIFLAIIGPIDPFEGFLERRVEEGMIV